MGAAAQQQEARSGVGELRDRAEARARGAGEAVRGAAPGREEGPACTALGLRPWRKGHTLGGISAGSTAPLTHTASSLGTAALLRPTARRQRS